MNETLVNWSCSEKLLLHVLQSEKKLWNIYLGVQVDKVLFKIWLWWHFIKVVAIKINRKIESNWFMTHCYLRTNISITCHLLYLDIPMIRNEKKSWNQISFFFFSCSKNFVKSLFTFFISVLRKSREIKDTLFSNIWKNSSNQT